VQLRCQTMATLLSYEEEGRAAALAGFISRPRARASSRTICHSGLTATQDCLHVQQACALEVFPTRAGKRMRLLSHPCDGPPSRRARASAAIDVVRQGLAWRLLQLTYSIRPSLEVPQF
jgi:hypothetical protein